MTIEQKINEVMKNEFCYHKPVRDWIWAFGIRQYRSWTWRGNLKVHCFCKIPFSVDEIIKTADLAECLTSPSDYIRKCKKRFMEVEND